MMIKAIRTLFYFGPLLFAFGFLVPLIAQCLALWNVPLPGGVSPLQAGLVLGGTLGVVAQVRGRWI